MSGTYDDIAPLRGGDDMNSGRDAESSPEDRPQAEHKHVPIAVAEPEGNARGGIVVLHECREVTGTLLDLMGALATEGWTVVAPNLFHRVNGDPVAEVFGDELFEDFDACFDWLTRRGVFPDCIGVLGFDHAGTAAFLVATNRPIGAAVSVAASATPPAHVDQLRDATARASVASLVVCYPGLHHRADYPGVDDDVDFIDSQTRIFDWFDSNLR
jgi:carboxymethylenebutenolidase